MIFLPRQCQHWQLKVTYTHCLFAYVSGDLKAVSALICGMLSCRLPIALAATGVAMVTGGEKSY